LELAAELVDEKAEELLLSLGSLGITGG